ncbi:nuclear transport factor 2 family protein [Ideonella livida]|uniref:Nuclear transport factor 2 family protein n=1 Tax=Ideonella livida TaxID=2707176 RepID=A0A7C9PID0_9BURK|nr:nuclear transport factor 2 family protein [Ideonella livida]NDY91971.1 nuclear transport factor 2 family protein [Ideonella livida]
MADEKDPLARLAAFYTGLTPADLDRLETVYTPEARFKDPFNEVQGVAAIRRIFAHMFEGLESPRFEVHQRIPAQVALPLPPQGLDTCLLWHFHFRLRGRAFTLRGASHVHLAADGRADLHRDYWDAAEELYAKLPLLGGLMRWLQRRLAS